MKLGGIEAGGTKMVCAIGDEQGNIFDRAVFPTEIPESTVPKMIAYFQDKGIEALGIGCFGPVDLNKKSATYGYITSTPKLAWRFYDFAGAFREALKVPVGFDTDVNGAVLGEVRFGAAKGCENALYITIGTGVGVGAYINGRLLHGLMHPEGGHIFLRKHPEDTYEGAVLITVPVWKDWLPVLRFRAGMAERELNWPEERMSGNWKVTTSDRLWQITC